MKGAPAPGVKSGRSASSAQSSPANYTGFKKPPTGAGGNRPNGKGRK